MPVFQLPQSTIPSWDLGTVAKSPREALNKEYRPGLRGYWSASMGGSEGVLDLSANKNHALNSGMVWGRSRFGRVITGTYSGGQKMPLLEALIFGSLPCTVWVHQQLDADYSFLMCQDDAQSYGMRNTPGSISIKASGHGEVIATGLVGTEWHQVLITVDTAGIVGYYLDGIYLGADSGMYGIFTIENLLGSVTYPALNGKFRACGIWDTHFTLSMIERLARDPYAVERKEEYVTVRGGWAGVSSSSVRRRRLIILGTGA